MTKDEKVMNRREFIGFVTNFFTEDNKPFATCLYRVFRDETGTIISMKPLTLNVEKNYGFMAVALDMLGINPDMLKTENSCVCRVFDYSAATKMLECYFASFLGDNLAEHVNIKQIISAKVNEWEIGVVICPNKETLRKKCLSLEEIHFKKILICNGVIDQNLVNEDFDSGLLPICVFFEDVAMSREQWRQKPTDNGPTATINYFPLAEWYKIKQ